MSPFQRCIEELEMILEEHSKLRNWLHQFPTDLRLDHSDIEKNIAAQEEQVRLLNDNARKLVGEIDNKLEEENQMRSALNDLELKLILTEPEIESVHRKLRIAKSQNDMTEVSTAIEVKGGP